MKKLHFEILFLISTLFNVSQKITPVEFLENRPIQYFRTNLDQWFLVVLSCDRWSKLMVQLVQIGPKMS